MAGRIETARKALLGILAFCLLACLLLRHRHGRPPRRIFLWLAKIVLKAELATCYLYMAVSPKPSDPVTEQKIEDLFSQISCLDTKCSYSVDQLLSRIKSTQKRLRGLPNLRSDEDLQLFNGFMKLYKASTVLSGLVKSMATQIAAGFSLGKPPIPTPP